MAAPLRLVEADDAAALAALRLRHRAFLQPWEPSRADEFCTEPGQRAAIEARLAGHEAGTAVPFVVVDDGTVVGELTLADIVRGAFQNAYLGYWIAQDATGRGLATRAVAAALDHAFGALDLHQVQAATLEHNHASQGVLGRNGFERVGLARRFMRIDGRWQDHVLFQRLAD